MIHMHVGLVDQSRMSSVLDKYTVPNNKEYKNKNRELRQNERSSYYEQSSTASIWRQRVLPETAAPWTFSLLA